MPNNYDSTCSSLNFFPNNKKIEEIKASWSYDECREGYITS